MPVQYHQPGKTNADHAECMNPCASYSSKAYSEVNYPQPEYLKCSATQCYYPNNDQSG